MAKIAVIPGDGIGTEVAREGVATLEHLARKDGLSLSFEWFDYGAERYLRDGTTLPDDGFCRLRDEFDAIYFGAVGDPRVPSNVHAKDILLGLRTRLDLYINLRPCRLYDDRLSPLKGKGVKELDFTVFRENTEGLYADVGGTFKQGTPDEVAVNEDVNTRKGVERIVRAAFDFARARGLTRVCMSDKANVLTHAHGLWRRVFAQVSREYPGIEGRVMLFDALCMDLVRAPERYQVIVTNNMFGDIVTDLGAALCGGLGLAASGNIHPGRVSLFEPVHGSAPDIAGKGVANPLAMCLTGALMLQHLGHHESAQRLESAVAAVVREGPLPPDLGGKASTREVGEAVRARL
jgi:3-isopropylmalate dehydrogenase